MNSEPKRSLSNTFPVSTYLVRRVIASLLILGVGVVSLPQPSEAVWWLVVKKVMKKHKDREMGDSIQREGKRQNHELELNDGYNPYHEHPDGRWTHDYNDEAYKRW